MLNALTVDLEDWFHPEYVSGRVDQLHAYPMIEEATVYVLKLLEELGIKSTFFVLGEIAVRHPKTVRDIKNQGHEIASHGYSHTPLSRMTPSDFAEETARTSNAIREAAGESPVGFRAPSFSLSNRTAWALAILRKNGYLYDSSVFPLRTPLYGVRGAPTHPYHPALNDICSEAPEESLVEFPLLTTSLAGIRVPASGGFYFRVLPTSVIRNAVFKANRHGHPAMMYLHPWELFARTPKIRLSPYRFFVSYANMRRVEKQIRVLAKAFRFGTVREVLGI
jgi:polysaccharide deacetylase family protein (PEP-CTERM system associated)